MRPKTFFNSNRLLQTIKTKNITWFLFCIYQIKDLDAAESESVYAVFDIGLDNSNNIQEHCVVNLQRRYIF